MHRANKRTKPRLRPPRHKEPPAEGRPNRALFKKRKNTTVWRQSRGDDDRDMDWVVSAASQHYRQTYVESRGGKPIRKKKTGIKSRDRPCKPKVVFPGNLDVLEALFPPRTEQNRRPSATKSFMFLLLPVPCSDGPPRPSCVFRVTSTRIGLLSQSRTLNDLAIRTWP